MDRFKAINDEDKSNELSDKLSGYVNVYAFLSQIIPYADPDLEMLYSYSKFLLPHLPSGRYKEVVKISDEVGLYYYRLERVFSGAIALEEGASYGAKSPTDVGTGKAKDEKAPLSEIIRALNDRFGTDFTEEDRLFFEQIKEKAVHHPQIISTAIANPLDKFQLGVRKMIEELSELPD